MNKLLFVTVTVIAIKMTNNSNSSAKKRSDLLIIFANFQQINNKKGFIFYLIFS